MTGPTPGWRTAHLAFKHSLENVGTSGQADPHLLQALTPPQGSPFHSILAVGRPGHVLVLGPSPRDSQTRSLCYVGQESQGKTLT